MKLNTSTLTKSMKCHSLRFWWLIFFAGTALAAISIQGILLPRFLPWMHAGHGLLSGGDWVLFHQLASETAQAIHREGWQVWHLRPGGNAPQGIAAALYALTGIFEPYVLIPLNAALHATAAVALMAILEELHFQRRTAVLAVLPLLLFPSAASWYSQIHKDGFFIAGNLLFLYGTVRAFNPRWIFSVWSSLPILIYITAGVFLVWIVREYGVVLLKVFGFIIFAIGLFWMTWLLRHKTIARNHVPIIFATLAAIPLISGIFQALRWEESRGDHYWIGSAAIQTRDWIGSAAIQTPGDRKNIDWGAMNRGEGSDIYQRWRKDDWMPQRVDDLLYTAAQMREGLVLGYPDAKAFIDAGHRANNSLDVLAHLPRSLQVGLAAPFPPEWAPAQGTTQSRAFRLVVGTEMAFVYVCLPFLAVGTFFLCRSVQFWITILYAGFFLTVFGYVVPNLGALHRMRYGFLMILVAIGAAIAIRFILSLFYNLRKNETEK